MNVSLLSDKSNIVKLCNVSRPVIVLIRFLDKYKHRNSAMHSKFSIFSKPLLSSQMALHPVYLSKFSIFLKPRK